MISKLGEIGQIITGNTPKTADIENYSSNDIMFIKPSDIQEDKLITLSQSEFYISEKARKKARVLPPGCILVTCIGIVGKVAINSCECAFNQQINAIIPNIEKCNTKYLAYAIQNQKQKLQDIANAAVVPILNKTQFSEIEITLPPLEEQHRIAALLDKVNDLIAKRRAQLDKQDLLVKAQFVEMFGDPVSNPMGWDIVELSHCLERIDNGKSLVCDTQPRQGNWPAILKLSAATYGYYKPKENKAMLNENEFVNSAEIQAGDLLFTRKNTPELVGMCAYVYKTPGKLMMPDLIFRLNTNETCNRIFLWKLINHDLFRENIKAISSGSAKSMSNISKERLHELKVILPPISLQQQFADSVRKLDQSKLTIQQSLDKLETLKKAMMQQYFG